VVNYVEPTDTSDDRTDKKYARPTIPIPGKYNRLEPLLKCDVPRGGKKDADFALSSK
jgi:hypothetical protein